MSLKAKILTQLKAKAKSLKITLTAARLNELAERFDKKIEKEEDIEAKIEDFSDVLETIAKQDSQVAALENQIKSHKPPVEADDEDDTDDEDDEEKVDTKPTQKKNTAKKERVPKWAQTLVSELAELKAEKQKTSLREKFINTLKEKNLPVHLAKHISIEKEEDIDAKVTELEADFKPVAGARAAISSTYRPVSSQGATSTGKTKEEIKKVFNH